MTDNFTFEEQRPAGTTYQTASGMAGFLIKKCGVPNEKSANTILVVVSIIILLISAYIFWGALSM